jgi:hypothetical protein
MMEGRGRPMASVSGVSRLLATTSSTQSVIPRFGKGRNAGLSGRRLTIELLKDLATGFVRKQIEERTGVKL